ncbi:unnamed protein product [Merluccius merluccius]
MNPYIVNVSAAARLCSWALCGGAGRCVRKHWDSDHYLHLDPRRYTVSRPRRGGPLAVGGALSQQDVGISTTLAPWYENRDPDPEYDHDHYRHYFYDDDVFNPDVFKFTAPSEDIWKTFELVPTPPMSPVQTGKVEPVAVPPLFMGYEPEWVTQFLDHQDLQDPQPCRVSPAHDSLSNLSSVLIQDCMWSGFSTGQQLEKVVAAASCTSKAGGRMQQQCVPVDTPTMADCVDPAAVFTFPLTGGKPVHMSSSSELHSDSSAQRMLLPWRRVQERHAHLKHLLLGAAPGAQLLLLLPHVPVVCTSSQQYPSHRLPSKIVSVLNVPSPP